jgi:hypothetical protein
MDYEINVSLNGEHFFATHKRSLQTAPQMLKVYNALRKAFPARKGYAISVTRWERIGHSVEPNVTEL